MRYMHRSVSAAPDASSPSAWTNHHLLVQVLEWRAARVVETYASLNAKGEIDASADQRVSRAVTEAFVAGQVFEMIDALPVGDPTKTIVSSLLRLVRLLLNIITTLSLMLRQYLLVTIESSLTDLLSFGLRLAPPNSVDPTNPLRMAVSRLCLELLPESIALSDAFGLTDWELDRYVYKCLLSMFEIHISVLSVLLAVTMDECMMHFGRGLKLSHSTSLPFLTATK